jgi:predicted CopG family antitoxin
METSIQLNKQTVQVLKDMKKKFGMKSYDELINSLIQKQKKTPKSMFGSNPDFPPFTEEDRFTAREYN